MLTINTQTPAPRRIGGGLDDPTPTPRTQARRTPATSSSPRRRPATAPSTAPQLPLPAAEVAEAVAILAPLVPASAGLPRVRLAHVVAAKLANHCAAAVNPPRESLAVDEARARCRAILDAFGPVERHAVLALLTHDVRAVSR
ncbi:MAG: hypothetical protein R2761_28750 [Acidimicrobiales bacterium]